VSESAQGSIKPGNWRRRTLIAVGICCALVLVFHRPLLLYIGRQVALHYAAKENLKIEFRLEGSVFTNLIVRNLHAVPTGPSDVESIDIELARFDYGLFALLRHGISKAILNVELKSARIVLNPAKAPLRPRPPNPKNKIELPDIFPERVRIADATAKAGLLNVRIREFRIVEDREPDRAIAVLWRTPEVQAFLRRNHMRFARRADGERRVLPAPMIVEARNATVAEILDRIAAGYRQSPPKVWVYQECTEKKETMIDVQVR